MKYDILLRILDRIREEAPSHYKTKYSPAPEDTENINQSRSRAFIHLYLKVLFGLFDFNERERTITDGTGDGGIDGYYIDADTKTVHLIQSKFRTTAKNFESKEIKLEEILAMDINRILEGELTDEAGIAYNGKIKQLQREISELPDIARYNYKVILLANLRDIRATKLRQLTGGFTADVFDFEKSYEKLIFPVISGTYFTASDITIPIDLSNKNAGSKISYTVRTKISDCEITVLFVPIIEIAKIMNKYKNSILRYNPRSYLDLEGQAVNKAIRNTVLHTDTNEFALFNNGITMLSEETNINEKIGQKNKAQLRVKNPQIINGGQTSFTLSRLYSENIEHADDIFADKEVLLKIITLVDNNSHASKLQLIDEISNATNKQTPVINADRLANEVFHLEIQRKVFDRYGLLYERKRGEFSDGIKDGYIRASQVVERNHFWRLFYSANGKINKGFQKKLFQRNEFSDLNTQDDFAFDRFYLAFHVFRRLKHEKNPYVRVEKDTYGKVFAYIEIFLSQGLATESATLDSNISKLESVWRRFIDDQHARSPHGKRAYIDTVTGEVKVSFNEQRYYKSSSFEKDLTAFFLKSKHTETNMPVHSDAPEGGA